VSPRHGTETTVGAAADAAPLSVLRIEDAPVMNTLLVEEWLSLRPRAGRRQRCRAGAGRGLRRPLDEADRLQPLPGRDRCAGRRAHAAGRAAPELMTIPSDPAGIRRDAGAGRPIGVCSADSRSTRPARRLA